MKRKPIVILMSCLLFSMLLVAVLYAFSDKGIPERNSFVRNYQPDMVTKSNELDIGYNSYYVAGLVNENIYLGNARVPLHLLITDIQLTDTQHVRLDIKDIENIQITKVMNLKVDSPYFYLADGLMPGLFRGKIGDWQAERYMYDNAYFNQSIPVGDSSFAIRTKSVVNMEYELGMINNDSPHVEIQHDLLEKQIKGTFCVDGQLNFSKSFNRLVYTYRYRNEYIVFDTDLSLDYRGQTIDTFSVAQIEIEKINSENSRNLKSRPKIINAQSCVSGEWLFIHSALLAKNDNIDALDKFAIIDVYDLKSNSYKLSFQIPNQNGARITQFKIFKNKVLAAIYDRYLVLFDLESQYLNRPDVLTNKK